MFACNPWVKGMPIMAHNGVGYRGHLNTFGRALLCTLLTNKPTNPLAHTPIHQAMNPAIHQSTNPCTQPCSPPHLDHQPTHLITNPHPRCSAPHHLMTWLFTIMWNAIQESTQESMVQSYITVHATLGGRIAHACTQVSAMRHISKLLGKLVGTTCPPIHQPTH